MGLFTGDKLTAFTFSHSAQIDAIYTVYSATQIKAFFDSRGTDLQTKHNVLIDDLALVVSPTNGAIATINSMANAGGDIVITGGTATTTTVTVANNTATKTIAISADVATTSLNGISMIGNNTTLQAGPGTSALTMGISTDTAARTITFTVNGTALPANHASTHAPGASDSIETYYYTASAAATLEAAMAGKANQTTVDNMLKDYIRQPAYAVTSGTSTAYIVTLNPAPTAYVDGMTITIKPHATSGYAPTLNVNNLGALTIVKQDGTSINSGDIIVNKPLSLVRVGSFFFIRNANESSVKSIQRGNGAGSITINAVDINKTLVRTPGTGGNDYTISAYARLVSATSIEVGYSYGGASIDWEVIEFKKIKNIQTGLSTTSPITISAINNGNASVFFSIKATSGDVGYAYGQPIGKINSSTSISWGLACGSVINATAYWTVIEWM